MSKRFESFVGMISSLSKEITRLKNEEMRRFGLNGTDGMCLYYLAKRPEGVTSAELARMMGVDRAVVSRALTRLDAGEYVAIHGSDDGRAGRFVSLTDKGLTVTREVDQVLADIVERAGRGVEGPDRDAMYDMMQAILSNLREIWAGHLRRCRMVRVPCGDGRAAHVTSTRNEEQPWQRASSPIPPRTSCRRSAPRGFRSCR